MKVLDPILWSNHNYSTPLQPNHRRHTFTTAAAVCLGCGLSLNSGVKHASYIRLIWVTCTIEMFVRMGYQLLAYLLECSVCRCPGKLLQLWPGFLVPYPSVFHLYVEFVVAAYYGGPTY